ncbi:NADPH:quinone reductase [Streptomyces roseochromogenus]|uniref:Oxidoreductase n=1 Tax=Streptomyces roseochromogenus subsp. oscitans DS 12.976 TaxID=1352936 RepID=V6JJE1_STRRC|nr:NADPH:quinone reductase [Streptomyces roseochromogenus]EST19241.1 oxidoreductase [Streptomyces roseochromogenus subsp. oscitans DS 12.976]
MRAAYIEELGPADVIRYGEIAAPRPGPTDVLVDVLATTVNPVDTFVRSGLFPTHVDFPFVVGRDLVGTVAQAGPGVTGLRAGDRVWCNSLGHGGRQGAAAEQAVVAADRLYRLPEGVDPYAAVAAVHPAATAYLALFVHGRLHVGETLLVAGAAGNVGSALVTMAVRAGARVLATAGSRDAQYCAELGAAEVFDYRDPDLAEQIRGAAPSGIDLYLDTAGVNDLETTVGLLARRGRVVLLAGARTRPVLPAGALYMNDRSVVGFVISHATPDELAEAAAYINDLFRQGVLSPRGIEVFPLSAAADVHARMEKGELRGRRAVLCTDVTAGD